MIKRVYKALPTMVRFHKSKASVRGIRGPRGSGKSTAMSMEIWVKSYQQKPGADGRRHTRWAVVRNTYRELADTALKTWLYWFDEDHFGSFNYGSMTHHVRVKDLDLEVIFRALDRPGDVKKLLSMELTGAWVNEAREIPFSIIQGLRDSIGRWPPLPDGGPTWHGLMMDTNSMSNKHWWYRLSEVEKPEGWEFFTQPGGLIEQDDKFLPNSKAENLQNLIDGSGYYVNRVPGQNRDHILVYYCNQYGFTTDGKPVIPEYKDHVHFCSDIEVTRQLPYYVGLDFGLTPAAVFGQRLPNGRWVWFDELVAEDMGAVRFAELLGPKLRGEYAGMEIAGIYGDPSGDTRAETDENTCFQILQAKGIPAEPAPLPNNDFTLRREAIVVPLSRIIDGKPGLMIGPKCEITREGLAGGYCYKRMQVSGDERFHEKPDKNMYSHPVEAGGYMMVGAGEADIIIEIPNLVTEKVRPRRFSQSGHGWMIG